MIETPGSRIAGWIVGVATALVIVGVAVALFLNPIWVGFEQARSGADVLTGYTPQEMDVVRDRVLSDLVFGPPTFDVQIRGETVLDAKERAHLVDVRGVFIGFGGAVGLAFAALVVTWLASRGRPWSWRALRAGATGLIGVIVVAGLVVAIAFDAAFELFHRLFFAGGTYTFDPARERLVQLFPDQFWSETSIAVGIVIVVLALVTRWLAGRRASTKEPETSSVRVGTTPSARERARP